MSINKKTLNIAFIGTRGVPAQYGGFETCVEEVGRRLVNKGHQVTVYCRKSYYYNNLHEYLGMRRISLPNLKIKSLDTISHTFLSVFHSIFKNYDIYMVFNVANSLFLLPLIIFRKKIAINTDGLEWQRSKWGFWGRSFYKISERISCNIANRLITDSREMKNYYIKKYQMDSTVIAYGASIQSHKSTNKLKDMGLKHGDYFLQITRFEPENHPLLTVKAFKRLKTNKKLVLVGGNHYPNTYTKAIQAEVNAYIFLMGFIYDKEILEELWCNCFAYIHGNSVGGTNPALLQAMASACFTISIDVPFNRDVLNECGIYFNNNEDSLVEKMKWALNNYKTLYTFGQKAQLRIIEKYSWDKVTDQYEKLFYEL